MDGRYMIVTYILKPDGKWDEITEFKKSVKNRYLTSARVILDLKEQKVVKNSLNPKAEFSDMLEFYKRQLGDQLTPFLPDYSSP